MRLRPPPSRFRWPARHDPSLPHAPTDPPTVNERYAADQDDEDVPTAPFWMTTFSDMMTLLMTFFVMIVAMSEVEVKKFEKALSHFQGQPSVLMHESALPTEGAAVPLKTPTDRFQSREQEQRYEELRRYLKENGLEDKVNVDLREDEIHVVIADSVMFRSGEARLIEPSRTVLQLLSALLNEDVASVVVEGHTDDRPIRTARFPSNWELSTARAASAVRFLQEHTPALEPSRYAAVGYGPHRPLDTGGTAAARARNRRVEILFNWNSWTKENPTPPPSRPATP